MDNTVERKIIEILGELGCTECRSYPRDDAYIKAMQRIFALFDHYTTTKISEVLDAVEEAIGEDYDWSHILSVSEARNELRAKQRESLKAIKEKYQL